MAASSNGSFDPKAFLASVGTGRSIAKSREGELISQPSVLRTIPPGWERSGS